MVSIRRPNSLKKFALTHIRIHTNPHTQREEFLNIDSSINGCIYRHITRETYHEAFTVAELQGKKSMYLHYESHDGSSEANSTYNEAASHIFAMFWGMGTILLNSVVRSALAYCQLISFLSVHRNSVTYLDQYQELIKSKKSTSKNKNQYITSK